uniref:Uncharacterized protein n=1 Tax=Erpetoichthys calabaricus TaxID=27687 RepID=A0A8C4X481_ERPCA
MQMQLMRFSNNRSDLETLFVMSLDVRSCTCTTLNRSTCVHLTQRSMGKLLNPICDDDRGLQLFPLNEKFPVSAGHNPAMIKSLPFEKNACCRNAHSFWRGF